MKKLTIICDLDGVVVDLHNAWLSWYNQKYGDTLEQSQLTTYEIQNHVKPKCGWKIFDFFKDVEAYRDLPALPGAVESLKYLHDLGHDIVIASAVAGDTAAEKFHWCKKNLPFVKRKNIFAGSRKELLHGDVFIDDAPKNIIAHREKWGSSTKIMTISYPYNEEVANLCDVYARCYQNCDAAWYEIRERIRRMPYDE